MHQLKPFMSEISGLERSVASSAEEKRRYHKHDAGPEKRELSENKDIVREYVEDAEKGSPPSYPPHVVKDGGFTAWRTVLGVYVESTRQRFRALTDPFGIGGA